jgi:hypothetical protein
MPRAALTDYHLFVAGERESDVALEATASADATTDRTVASQGAPDVTSGESRKVVQGDSSAHFLADDALHVIGWEAISIVPDDLSRQPTELKRFLRALHEIDEHDSLIGPR